MLYNSEDESGEFILELFSSIPLFGSIANAVFIVCGALAGLLLRKKIPAKIMELPVQGMALFVVTLGVGMAIKTQQPLVVIASIALGSLIGELMDLEGDFTASAFVKETTGVDCVCERSAILAGGGAELLLKKRAANGVTVALALKDWSVDFG